MLEIVALALVPFLQSPPETRPAEPEVATPRAAVEALRPAMETLLSEGFAELGAWHILTELCTVAPHRLAGSAGAERAVAWARAKMEAIGLENVRLEPVSVPVWVRGEVEDLRFAGPASLAGQTLAIRALGGSVATPAEGIEGEVVEILSWEQLEELGDAVRGKILFFNRPMDPRLVNYGSAYGGAVDQRSRGAIEAARRGAVAAVVRSMTTRLDDFPHTGAMGYEAGVAQVPGVAVSTLGAERLARLLRAGEPVRLRLRLACKTLPDAQSANVVGEIVGRERPEEIVLVGGHLDCWDVGQGAADDGAGISHSLEAARLLLAHGLRPRRTVRVVLYMNEENGLRGGLAYRETHAPELHAHVLALESDTGAGTPRGFTLRGPDAALPLLREIGSLLAEGGIGFVRPGYSGADVGAMEGDSVPGMAYVPDLQRYFDLHHSDRDTLEAISPRELQLGACVIAGMLYAVAELEESMPTREAPSGAGSSK